MLYLTYMYVIIRVEDLLSGMVHRLEIRYLRR